MRREQIGSATNNGPESKQKQFHKHRIAFLRQKLFSNEQCVVYLMTRILPTSDRTLTASELSRYYY